MPRSFNNLLSYPYASNDLPPYETKRTHAGEVAVFPGTNAEILEFLDWVLPQGKTAGEFIALHPELTREDIRDYILSALPAKKLLPRWEQREWDTCGAFVVDKTAANLRCPKKAPFETLEGVFGGAPLFPDSRVPVYYLVDFIYHDESLDEFFFSWGDQVAPEAVESLLKFPLPLALKHAPKSLV